MEALIAVLQVIAVFMIGVWIGAFIGGLVMGLYDSASKGDPLFIFSDLEPAEKILFLPFFITYNPLRKMLG